MKLFRFRTNWQKSPLPKLSQGYRFASRRYRDRMGTMIGNSEDRRTRRTREAVFQAFARLVLNRRYSSFAVADIVAEAGIGRSTFYEHFHGKDEVLLEAIEPIFLTLVDAAIGNTALGRVQATVEHIWQQRSLARIIFEPPLHQKLRRKLAAMIESRLDENQLHPYPPALLATALAASQLAILQMWVAGDVTCPPKLVAAMLMQGFVAQSPDLGPKVGAE
jgi:AcrR family transcriptional regulator